MYFLPPGEIKEGGGTLVIRREISVVLMIDKIFERRMPPRHVSTKTKIGTSRNIFVRKDDRSSREKQI